MHIIAQANFKNIVKVRLWPWTSAGIVQRDPRGKYIRAAKFLTDALTKVLNTKIELLKVKIY